VDLRELPLSMRKTNLARLLARRPEGIFAYSCAVGRADHCLMTLLGTKCFAENRRSAWARRRSAV
jgi:hypothetical protein